MITDVFENDYALLFGDCLARLGDVETGCVDLVLCDLPYGTTQNKWDSVIPLPALWAQYNRVLRAGGVAALCCGQPFTSALICSNLGAFRYTWVWEKNFKTGHLNAHHMPMRKHEDIAVFCSGSGVYNPQGLQPYNRIKKRGHNGDNYGESGAENFQEFTNYPFDILRFDRDLPSIHPTQKPVALMEYLVKTYTNPGDTVLDSCFGSCSTGVACRNTGRNFIGIEREEKYFSLGVERLRATGANIVAMPSELQAAA